MATCPGPLLARAVHVRDGFDKVVGDDVRGERLDNFDALWADADGHSDGRRLGQLSKGFRYEKAA